MGHHPGYEDHRALYARYYGERGVADLLRLLDPLDGMNVLDLCGGDGRLTLKALAAGAREVMLVDAEFEMTPSNLWRHAQVRVVIKEVRLALHSFIVRNQRFDRAVCQQAVNYWLDASTAGDVARVLNPGGIFAFNTFYQQPSEEPRVLHYKLGGHSFAEVSWLVGGDVHHLQVRGGMRPHHTVFQWLSPERLRELLEPHFLVTEERREKTSLYRCEKRR